MLGSSSVCPFIQNSPPQPPISSLPPSIYLSPPRFFPFLPSCAQSNPRQPAHRHPVSPTPTHSRIPAEASSLRAEQAKRGGSACRRQCQDPGAAEKGKSQEKENLCLCALTSTRPSPSIQRHCHARSNHLFLSGPPDASRNPC